MNVSRSLFRGVNKIINKFGFLLSKPEKIHGSPAFSGATLWCRRLNDMKYFYGLIKDVKGGVVESGVHWGYGILIHLTLTDDRNIYGFDSFVGHSKPTKEDKSGGAYKAHESSFAVKEEDLWQTLLLGLGKKQNDFGGRVKLIKGWIQETMPAWTKAMSQKNEKIALVHADCDIYIPFKATLESCWPLLSSGGVIIIGRLNNPELMGKTAAVNEFLETLPENSYKLNELTLFDNGFVLQQMHYLIKA